MNLEVSYSIFPQEKVKYGKRTSLILIIVKT